jgi:hypothetical protein
MNVIIRPSGVSLRPTGAPLNVGATLGFGPNGSSASLDTAPDNPAIAATDYLLVQSAGTLVKVSGSWLLQLLSRNGPVGTPPANVLAAENGQPLLTANGNYVVAQ